MAISTLFLSFKYGSFGPFLFPQEDPLKDSNFVFFGSQSDEIFPLEKTLILRE